MARRRFPLEYLACDSARKASLKRRKKGLFRKMNELSVRCGINACAIIYSTCDSEPEIWPPSHMSVYSLLIKFMGVPENVRSKKMVSHKVYIMERIKKVDAQRKKLRTDNREKEMRYVMNQCLSSKVSVSTLSAMDLHDLGSVIDNTLTVISKRIEFLKNSTEQPAIPVSSPPPLEDGSKLTLNPDGNNNTNSKNINNHGA